MFAKTGRLRTSILLTIPLKWIVHLMSLSMEKNYSRKPEIRFILVIKWALTSKGMIFKKEKTSKTTMKRPVKLTLTANKTFIKV